jgi:hypothetical protein
LKIRIIAEGFKSNRNLLDHLTGQGIKNDMRQILHQIGLDIVDEARYNLTQNGNFDTGGLHGSIRILNEDDDSVTVGTDALHAIYIEFGRGPVTPKDPDGWLHWFDKKSGREIFAKYSGPVEAMPFLQPAVEVISKRFGDLVSESNDDVSKGLLKNDREEL